MTLIQGKQLFSRTEYQLMIDHIVVSHKRLFTTRRSTIKLGSLSPEPVFDEHHRVLRFSSAEGDSDALCLYQNDPDEHRFSVFVNRVIEQIIALKSDQSSPIQAYSQRLTPPFSGLVQIAESKRARALTMDGKNWEFQHLHLMLDTEGNPRKPYRKRFSHALSVDRQGLVAMASDAQSGGVALDGSLVELARFLVDAEFPFPSTDLYEYWLLDKRDDSPLAMIFSCSEAEQMSTFPSKNEWTSLPAAAMPVDMTDEERSEQKSPVNRRVEQMVNERAGSLQARARWFKRSPDETEVFPPLLLSEAWEDEVERDLCRRYLERQSSRLLMLQHLSSEQRKRLEISARSQALEVERFHTYYPEIVDQKLLKATLVEAVLRRNTPQTEMRPVENRRDGIHYL